ncbi:MAG: hypothetical protein ABSE59_09940 [Opitutaceae bacterium]|jgi:hypothetical protein
MSLPPDAHSVSSPAQPSVPWISVAAVFGCFALFLLIIYIAYLPQREATAEADLTQVAPDDRWQYSPEGRADRLKELRASEQTELTSYGWIDQKAGVVRLPIDRAMELTVQSLQAKK